MKESGTGRERRKSLFKDVELFVEGNEQALKGLSSVKMKKKKKKTTCCSQNSVSVALNCSLRPGKGGWELGGRGRGRRGREGLCVQISTDHTHPAPIE